MKHDWQFFADGTAKCESCGMAVISSCTFIEDRRGSCKSASVTYLEPMMTTDEENSGAASTARTDGWVSVPHDLLMELRGVVVGEWNFAPLESDKAKYLHTLWTQIDAIRFPAAPGSVPQAEPPKEESK